MQEAPVSEQLGGQIISIKKARKLLGSKYDNVPDEIVELMVLDMTILSARLIDWQNCSTESEGVVSYEYEQRRGKRYKEKSLCFQMINISTLKQKSVERKI